MGIPYSREISAAFDQVTPLVAQGFEVLETTKNISLFVAGLQVCATLILACILAMLVALSFIVNPDLEKERQALVTPVMKWFASWMMQGSTGWIRSGLLWSFLTFVSVVGGSIWYVSYVRKTDAEALGAAAGESNDLGQGKDVEAVKKGQSKQ